MPSVRPRSGEARPSSPSLIRIGLIAQASAVANPGRVSLPGAPQPSWKPARARRRGRLVSRARRRARRLPPEPPARISDGNHGAEDGVVASSGLERAAPIRIWLMFRSVQPKREVDHPRRARSRRAKGPSRRPEGPMSSVESAGDDQHGQGGDPAGGKSPGRRPSSPSTARRFRVWKTPNPSLVAVPRAPARSPGGGVLADGGLRAPGSRPPSRRPVRSRRRRGPPSPGWQGRLPRRAHEEDAAAFHDHAVRRETKARAHVLLDEQDRLPPPPSSARSTG